jgi:hypothetical protein
MYRKIPDPIPESGALAPRLAKSHFFMTDLR